MISWLDLVGAMARPESSSAYLKEGRNKRQRGVDRFTRLRACTEYSNCLTSSFCRIQQVSGQGMEHAKSKTAELDGLLPHLENRVNEFVSLLVA